MFYCGLMGYGFKFSANRLGGHKKLWDTGVYGFKSEAWVMRVSTVVVLREFSNSAQDFINKQITTDGYIRD